MIRYRFGDVPKISIKLLPRSQGKQFIAHDNQSPWVGDVLAEPGPELGEAEEDEGVGHEERVADGQTGQQGREGIPARRGEVGK